MNSMKQLGLTAALAVGMTLLTNAPATARESVQLLIVGDEPQATGRVTFGSTKLVEFYLNDPVYACKLSISCQNLTPGATYTTNAGEFVANRKGDGKVAGWAARVWGWTVFPVYVDRVNGDGTFTTVLLEEPLSASPAGNRWP